MPTNMPPKPAMPQSAPGMGGKALIGLGCLAVGLVVGYGAGRVSTGTPINPLTGQKGGYEQGRQDAIQKITDSGVLPPAPTSSPSLQGSVTSVSGNSLTMEADLQTFDPLGVKGLPTVRTVTVTDATVIVRLTEMTPEEFNAAQAAFQRASASFQPDPEDPSVTPPAPPSPFEETTIGLADLKASDIVIVTASADILAAASFEAVRITVAPQATQTPTGAPAPPTASGETPPPPPPPEDAPSDGAATPPAPPAP